MLKVFIGCLPGDCDRQDLAALIEQYVAIKKLAIVTHKNSSGQSYCKGYGFAICQSEADLEKLVEMDGKIYYGDRPLNFRRYKTGSSLSEERAAFNRRRVFVGNIPSHLEESQVADLLLRFGPIKKVYFIANTSDKKLKFGYAVFQHESTVQHILYSNPRIKTCGVVLRIESFGGKKAANQLLDENLSEKKRIEDFHQDASPAGLDRKDPSPNSILAIRKAGSVRQALPQGTYEPLPPLLQSHQAKHESRPPASKLDMYLNLTKTHVVQNHQPSNIRLNLSMPASDLMLRLSKRKSDE